MINQSASLKDKASVVVFSRVLGSLVELATIIFLVRMLTETDFAIVSMLLLVYESAKYFATLGFPDSVFYFFERVAKGARRAFALQTCAIMLFTGTLAALLILIFNSFLPVYLSEWSPESVSIARDLMPVMALIAFFEIPTWPVNNIMLASDRQKDASLYQLLNGILTLMAMVVPLMLGYTFDVAIWSLLGYSVLRFLISLVWVLRILPASTEKMYKGVAMEQVKFAIPIGLSSLVSRLNRYADKFIVSFFVAEEAFAIYMVGAQEVPLVKVIPFAIGSVLISRFVALYRDLKKEEFLELWHKSVQKTGMIVIPLSVMFIVVASEFILLLFGAGYEGAVLPFQIYTLIILIRVAHYGAVLQAFGDTGNIVRLSINLLVSNIVLTIPLTYYFGIIGAVSGTLIANLYNWVVVLHVIGKHLNLPWYKVIPFGNYFRVLFASVLAGMVIFGAGLLITIDHTAIVLIVKVALYLVLFLVGGHLFGVISGSDRRYLLDIIQLKFIFRKHE